MKTMLRLFCSECGNAFERAPNKIRNKTCYTFCGHECRVRFYRKFKTKSGQFRGNPTNNFMFHCNNALRPFRKGEKMAAWQLADYMDITVLRAMLIIKTLMRQHKLEIDRDLSSNSSVPVYRLGQNGRDNAERDFALNHLPETWKTMFSMCKSNKEYNHKA